MEASKYLSNTEEYLKLHPPILNEAMFFGVYVNFLMLSPNFMITAAIHLQILFATIYTHSKHDESSCIGVVG